MYIVSYDVTSDKLRNKIHKKLKNYGTRVQYSVFECDIGKGLFAQMYKEMLELTAETFDGSIRFYFIDKTGESKILTIGNEEKYKSMEDDLYFI